MLVLRRVRDHLGVDEPGASGLGNHEIEIGVVGLELHDVAGVRLGDDDVACREIVGVVVAGESPDLTLVLLFLDQVDGLLHGLGGGLRQRAALRQHQHAEAVLHVGEQADLALEGGIPQVVDLGDRPTRRSLVVGQCRHAAHVRRGVLAAGVRRVVEQVGPQVLPVRHPGVTDLVQPAQPLEPECHELGRHGQIGADVLLARQRLLVLGEPFLVVVEVFLVVHGQLAGGLEGGDEPVGHVQRPVRDAQIAGRR